MLTNPEEVEDFRKDQGSNPLIVFTLQELKYITGNFRRSNILGEGGFGRVYRGLLAKAFREGIQPIDVAVKVHDGEQSFQGHREWLVQKKINFLLLVIIILSFFFFSGGGYLPGSTVSSEFSQTCGLLL